MAMGDCRHGRLPGRWALGEEHLNGSVIMFSSSGGSNTCKVGAGSRYDELDGFRHLQIGEHAGRACGGL